MDLADRLQGIVEVLIESNERMNPESNAATFSTGFLPLHPLSLLDLARAAQSANPVPGISLDLMCGNGGWALMAAALGRPSYGIEINEVLVEEAQRNRETAVARGFIDRDVPCRFAAGSVFVGAYHDAFVERAAAENLSTRYGPRTLTANPYEALGVQVADAAIIYAFCWASGMGFLCEFLDQEARDDALFILPTKHRDSALALEAVTDIPGPYQVMKRREPST